MSAADGSNVSMFIMVYSGVVVLLAGGALAAFLGQVANFKRTMREILGDLGDGSQFRAFTTETGTALQGIFARVPAMAFCFQSYLQALIPPQQPYDPYYRSGREAAHAFDRDFILKTSLGLRLYNVLPSILISLGALGTIMGLAASIYTAQPLLAEADAKSLGELVAMLFDIGGKAFWPAGLGIIGAIAFLIVERVQTSGASDMVQAVTMVLDSGLTPNTIEQISATSLTELRLTHKTLVEFTNSYFDTLHATVARIISKDGASTVEELLERSGERFVAPLHRDVVDFRNETQANFDAIRSFATEMLSRLTVEIENARTMVREEIAQTRVDLGERMNVLNENVMASVSRLEEGLRGLAKVMCDGQELLRHDLLAKMEWIRGELEVLAKGLMQNDNARLEQLASALGEVGGAIKGEIENLRHTVTTEFANIDIPSLHMRTANIAHNLTGLHEVVRHNIDETRGLRDSFGAYSARSASDVDALRGTSEDARRELREYQNGTRDLLSSQFGAQAELTQTILAQMRDTAQIMAADLHQTTKVLEDVVAVDMSKQTHLLQELTDRVGMQTNRVTETVISVGEDLAHRVGLVSTILVGEDITGDVSHSPFLSDVKDTLHKRQPDAVYAEIRARNDFMGLDRRLREGEDRRASGRADTAARERLEKRTGLIDRVENLHTEIKAEAGKIEGTVREDMVRVLDTLQDHVKLVEDHMARRVDDVASRMDHVSRTLGDRVEDVNAALGRRLEGVTGEVSHRLEDLLESMSVRVEKLGRRMDARIADISDRVQHELRSISEEVNAISEQVDMRRIDEVADDVAAIGEYLSKVPLSTIKVVSMGSSDAGKPGGLRVSRRRMDRGYDDARSSSRRSRDEDDDELHSYDLDDEGDDRRYDRDASRDADSRGRRTPARKKVRSGKRRVS